jgi:hypothetical protein
MELDESVLYRLAYGLAAELAEADQDARPDLPPPPPAASPIAGSRCTAPARTGSSR